MRNTWFLACGVASLIACGGSGNNTVDSGGNNTVDSGGSNADGAGSNANEVQGQVEGRAFDAKDAISKQFSHTNGFSFIGSATFVEMTDYAGACALAGQDLAPTDSRILDLGVAINDSAGKATVPTGPGTFTVYSSANQLPASSNVAQVYYGSGCTKNVAYSGTSGAVTITNVNSDGSLKGTFDVVVSCAGFSSCAGPDAHLTGTFSSAACAALDVNVIPACS
jgi:hypothetical protein